MPETNESAATILRCPIDGTALKHALRSGAGWCGTCCLWTQAFGLEMPQLSEEIKLKRELIATAAKITKARQRKITRPV
ncbi:MAG TPA: hypothetical protein VFD58_32110 [Blastocatellia bacterium]|nr:hypothetical protein [Blastocatellia bacterium]